MLTERFENDPEIYNPRRDGWNKYFILWMNEFWYAIPVVDSVRLIGLNFDVRARASDAQRVSADLNERRASHGSVQERGRGRDGRGDGRRGRGR